MLGRLPVFRPQWACSLLFTILLIVIGGKPPAAQASLLPAGPPNVADHSPLLTADGSHLYFSRRGHERNLGRANTDDIWILPARTTGWGTPLNAGAPINSNLSDQAIGIDVSGNRLAIIRRGNGLPYIDLLERSGRSWRITATRLLPDAAVAATDLCYSFSDDLLLFSTPGATADLDISVSFYAPTFNSWSPAELLPSPLNSAADEYAVSLAPDGHTCYLQRRSIDGTIQRLRAELSIDQDQVIVQNLHSFTGTSSGNGPLSVAVSSNRAVTSQTEADRPTRLYEFSPAVADLPPPATIITGRLGTATGQRPENDKLRLLVGGQTQEVFVDRYGFYTYLSPPGTTPVLLSDTPGYYLLDPEIRSSPEPDYENNYELAATRFSPDYRRREAELAGWRAEISTTGTERTRLQRDRRSATSAARAAGLVAGQPPTAGYEDPELAALRHRYAQANGELPSVPGTDTVPPPTSGWTPRNGTVPAPTEADALRAKYQRAQELRRQRSNGNYSEAPATTSPPPAAAGLPSPTATATAPLPVTTYRGLPPRDPGIKSPVAVPDSSGMSGAIREGLYQNNAPAYYEEEAWEKKLGSKLDTRPGGPPPAAPLNPPPAAGTPYIPPSSPVAAPVYPTPPSSYPGPSSAYPPANTSSAYPPPATAPPFDQRMQSAIEAQRYEERQLGLGTTPIGDNTTVNGLSPAAATPAQDNVSSPGNETTMLSLVSGTKVVLENLRFAPNSAILKPTAEAELARLTYYLQSNPDVRIEIGAHTAGRLSYDFAQRLSDARAAAVRERLIRQGIDGSRIEARGYGKQVPTDGLQRIELRVL